MREFGRVEVDWPNKDAGKQPSRFCFVEFEDEYQVFRYLIKCQMIHGRFFNHVKLGKKMFQMIHGRFLNHVKLGKKMFQVECKPFFIKNSRFGCDDGHDVDTRSVFLGGLPRETTAFDLQQLLSIFGEVTQVVIDLHHSTNYPRGTAVVTFRDVESVKAAIYARIVQYLPTNSHVCRNVSECSNIVEFNSCF
uniref:RRM domain-containing protein n=1 Tax=Panagrolaimus sp. JU765 TaxID=591449 RepID=A0AC34RNK0_9BILA